MAAYTTIDDPGIYFNPKLYTGTGSSLAVTGVGFQPDFTWIKNRDTTDINILTDAVRGATKYMNSAETAAEVTNTESLKSFDSDGFTVGTQVDVNTNTEDFASWNWKAGTTTGIAGSPSITPSSYSFNATSGFSIIAYTGNDTAGATLPHGLGVAPQMIIVKKVDATDLWAVYHQGMDATGTSIATAPEDYYMKLDLNTAKTDALDYWNDTAPTSSLFYLGDSTVVNASANTYVAYCFANVQGYSKFGSYVGNGNVVGAFVYTGFRPAYVMAKRSDGADNWLIWDNKRLGYNESNMWIYANLSLVEGPTYSYINILSTGFQLTTTDTGWNAAAGSYIYMAFADSPIVNSNGVPTNAR